MSLKGQVRAAHGRAARLKPTYFYIPLKKLLVMGLLERSSPTVSSPVYSVSWVSDHFIEQMT
jgi:hypothetical protein